MFRLIYPCSFESVFSLIPFKGQAIPPTAALGENVSFGSAAGAALRSIGDAANGGLGTITVYLGKSADGYSIVTQAYHSQVWLIFSSYIWLLGIAILMIYSIAALMKLQKRIKNAVHEKDNIYLAEHLDTPRYQNIVKYKKIPYMIFAK